MAFVPRPNTGTLWPNDKRTSDNQPNVRGDIFIDRSLIKKALENSEDMVQLSIAGWTKELGGKKALSLIVSEPYKKPKATEPVDEDVPF